MDSRPEPGAPELSESSASRLLDLARESIAASVRGLPQPGLPQDPALSRAAGVFVTLHRQGTLRGCLGHLEADHTLAEITRRMAVASAHDDPRFPPLGEEELSDVAVEISILTPLRRVQPEDIVTGRDGVVVRRGNSQGVFLPQVATEQGWGRDAFLSAACRKAGLPELAWKDRSTSLFSFEARVLGAALHR